MTELIVEAGALRGFGLDLQDIATNFSSTTSSMLSSVTIPAGTPGLLGTLAGPLEQFRTVLTQGHERDLAALSSFTASLGTAAREFEGTESASAQSISASAGMNAAVGNDAAVARFTGLQLPVLPSIEAGRFTVRQVVESAAELISHFDDPLHRVIGIKPAADYLTPLAADWEVLDAVGGRIQQLGVFDFVTAQNLTGGLQWLQSRWSGAAARAFAASVGGSAQAVGDRGSDLDVVAKIVVNAGACLERLAYNQAIAWSGGLAAPMSFLGFTLPLGVWAQLIDRPMNESMRSQIVAAIDELRRASDARHDAITTMIGNIGRALGYTPGRTAPSFSSAEYEVPDKVITDFGSARYGFGGNVWWESSGATPS